MIIDFLPHSDGGAGAHSHDHSHSHDRSHDHKSHGSHGHSHSHSHTETKGDVIPAKALSSAIHTIAHHGFTLEDVKLMFEEAGASEGFEVANLGGAIVFSSGKKEDEKDEDIKDFKRVVFMARGVKL